MLVFTRWSVFERHSVQMYERQGGLSLGLALALSLALSVPGEELFWRGLVQEELASALDGRIAVAAVVAWVAFVVANLPSANLAIAAGAVVGGAVWGALAWWTGGVLAPLACHVVWTGLMIALPVVRPAGRACDERRRPGRSTTCCGVVPSATSPARRHRARTSRRWCSPRPAVGCGSRRREDR